MSKNCKCGKTYGYNYRWADGKMINTVSLDQVETLFVHSTVAFNVKFIEYHIRLHFRGFLSSRSISWASDSCIWDRHCVDHRRYKSFNDARTLLVSMKEFGALPQRTFHDSLAIGDHIRADALDALDRHVHQQDFPPADPSSVDIVSLDGHEKVTVKVCRTEDIPTKRTGKPRKNRKGKRNKPYTCGWFMATDPKTGCVLGVEEQKQPENNQVKKKVLKKMLHRYSQYDKLDAVLHDRNCSLMTECERTKEFPQIKYWIIDKWHGAKHKRSCKCRPQSHPRLARRIKGINTSVSEQVFSWFRNYSRTMNEMRSDRHRLFVLHYCKMHNELIRAGDRSHLNEFAVRNKTVKALQKRASRPYAC